MHFKNQLTVLSCSSTYDYNAIENLYNLCIQKLLAERYNWQYKMATISHITYRFTNTVPIQVQGSFLVHAVG